MLEIRYIRARSETASELNTVPSSFFTELFTVHHPSSIFGTWSVHFCLPHLGHKQARAMSAKNEPHEPQLAQILQREQWTRDIWATCVVTSGSLSHGRRQTKANGAASPPEVASHPCAFKSFKNVKTMMVIRPYTAPLLFMCVLHLTDAKHTQLMHQTDAG